MVSYSGEIVKDSSFAKIKGQPDAFRYQEGPWDLSTPALLPYTEGKYKFVQISLTARLWGLLT